jgi:hypothetical protein
MGHEPLAVGTWRAAGGIIQWHVTMQHTCQQHQLFAQKSATLPATTTDPLIEGYRRRGTLYYEGLKDKYRIFKQRGALFHISRGADGEGDALSRGRSEQLFIYRQRFPGRKSNVRSLLPRAKTS